MKYTATIDINQPIDRVVDLFTDPDNLEKWMDGLQSVKHLSGEEGQPGSKTEMHFQMGKRAIHMVETLEVYNLPTEMRATYEADGVVNLQRTHFESIAENQTRYVAENEFQFAGFMKVMGWLMPGAFKKQTMKYLESFKRFAEAAGGQPVA